MWLPLRRRPQVPENDEPIIIPPVQQPEDMDDEERQMIRIAAQMEVQTINSLRDLVIREISTSLRWAQASLLVVNGGGAVAALQIASLSGVERGASGACFVVGIILALLTATSGVRAVRDTPKKLTYLMGYWMSVTVDLLRSEEIERDWQQYSAVLDSRGRLPWTLGYLSGVAFVLGCAIIGLGGL